MNPTALCLFLCLSPLGTFLNKVMSAQGYEFILVKSLSSRVHESLYVSAGANGTFAWQDLWTTLRAFRTY